MRPLPRPRDITSDIPLRLIGIGSHSGYSSAAFDRLWPFGIATGPIDRVRADRVVERHPTLSFLPMNAPEFPDHLVSGIYDLESDAYRWMSGTGRGDAEASLRASAAGGRIPYSRPGAGHAV